MLNRICYSIVWSYDRRRNQFGSLFQCVSFDFISLGGMGRRGWGVRVGIDCFRCCLFLDSIYTWLLKYIYNYILLFYNIFLMVMLVLLGAQNFWFWLIIKSLSRRLMKFRFSGNPKKVDEDCGLKRLVWIRDAFLSLWLRLSFLPSFFVLLHVLVVDFFCSCWFLIFCFFNSIWRFSRSSFSTTFVCMKVLKVGSSVEFFWKTSNCQNSRNR